MTSDELRKLLSKPGYGVTATTHKDFGGVPNTKPERVPRRALGGGVQGKEAGVQRTVVRFTGYRVRPLDPDNFAGSIKDLLDGLRHAGLIPGDEPWRIRLETDQEKVASFKQERTEIEIIYGDGHEKAPDITPGP